MTLKMGHREDNLDPYPTEKATDPTFQALSNDPSRLPQSLLHPAPRRGSRHQGRRDLAGGNTERLMFEY